MSKTNPVVIVGAGVGGLAAACALASRGIASRVLERSPGHGTIDRGDVLHRSTLQFLDRWSARPVLDDSGPLRLTVFRILNGRGQEVFRCNLEKDLSAPAVLTVLRHPDIQQVLERHAIASGLVTIERGVKVVGLVERDNRVLGVRTEASEARGPLTILATGTRSSVRDRDFGPSAVRDYGVSFVNLRCRRVPGLEEAGCYVLGTAGVMILLPLPGNELRIGLQVPNGSVGQTIESDAARRLVGERLGGFPSHQLEILGSTVYRLSRLFCGTFSRSGAVVLGDAAHTTHPAGGQGMNLAFQDAECLAANLDALDLCDSASVDSALERFSRKRMAQSRRVLRRTHAMGMLGLYTSPAYVHLRELILRMANRTRPLKRIVFRRVVDVS